jgi:hypothetical protein
MVAPVPSIIFWDKTKLCKLSKCCERCELKVINSLDSKSDILFWEYLNAANNNWNKLFLSRTFKSVKAGLEELSNGAIKAPVSVKFPEISITAFVSWDLTSSAINPNGWAGLTGSFGFNVISK